MEKGVNEVSNIFSVIVAIMVALTGLCGTLPETGDVIHCYDGGYTADPDGIPGLYACGEVFRH